VVDPYRPDRDVIQRAASKIRRGGLVVFPTRGLYGIGADIHLPDALEKVFQAKKRPSEKPVSVLIPSSFNVEDLAEEIPEAASRLMEAFWPGRLTIVFPAKPGNSGPLCGKSKKIGIRLPSHPVAAALVDAVGRPITATSANISGNSGCADPKELDPELIARVELILDAGRLLGGAGSTVIDVAAEPPLILREGAATAAEIVQCIDVFTA
jgi:L-threonylcarbamoyladenylate synthase